jgi:class 3 adenylate cyclase
VVSYRQEKESRSAYFVTQTMDDERRKLVAERQKSERLLYAILPQKIATKLKMNEGSIADTFYDVTVMFVSIHNFTSLTSSLNHFEQVSLLNKIFSKFDKLTEHHKLEKIKTIGATYLVVGGLPVPKANHLSSIAELALDMQEAISQFRAPNGEKYKIKAGIHCGKVVAGVIGIYKFSYDLWGDTVNTASRMESHSLPGQVQVTEACQKKLASRFEFSDRGFIQVKGKGVMHTFFLTRQIKDKPKLLSSISSERLPNVVVPERGNFSD